MATVAHSCGGSPPASSFLPNALSNTPMADHGVLGGTAPPLLWGIQWKAILALLQSGAFIDKTTATY